MLTLIITLSAGDIARLVLNEKSDSLLMVLEESVSPGDFTLAFDILMERNGDEELLERILQMGRKKFGRRFMLRRAFDLYMYTGNVKKALNELNQFYSHLLIAQRLKDMEELYGREVWKHLKDMKNIRTPMRRGIIVRLFQKGESDRAIPFARDAGDSIFLARLLLKEGKYGDVVELLAPLYGKDREAAHLYGKALFMLGRYREAAPILEGVDPALSSKAYSLSGNIRKAMEILPDTTMLIKYYFEIGEMDSVLKLCGEVILGECVAALSIKHPDSLNILLMNMAVRARRVEPIAGILLQVVQKYDKKTAVAFMKNALMGSREELPQELSYLADALYRERHNDRRKAIESYSHVRGWAEPFALYRLYILTGKEVYKKSLMEKFPQTAYSAMVSP